jgi:hypothetical protein
MDNIQGNVSTIAVFIYTILAPYIAQYISQEVFLALFGLILVLWSAYNPNTFKFLGNDKPAFTLEDEEMILNDEYECDDDGC